MRMLFPTKKVRKKIVELLERFFDEYQKPDFEAAIAMLAEFYQMPVPPIEFYQYINHGRWGGATSEDGDIELQHPEDWKKAKTSINTKKAWVHTVLHEWAHYLYWSEAEQKADLFANRFLSGKTK